jgi:nucleoside-diphosphate-sugar epimerase
MIDAVLVTGATGFVGSHLCSALAAMGLRVYRHSSKSGNIASCPLEFEEVRHVFHLAGKTFVPDSWESPHGFYEANVLGTVNVLEFCRRSDAALTFVSSYVYGTPKLLPVAEDHPLQALNPYSHTKILAEQAVCYYGSDFGVRSVIVRPFNIYGPGQVEPFLVPKLIRQALDPACDTISVSDVLPRRDYIHVRDVIALLISTMAAPAGSVFNAGSGCSFSIQDLIARIGALTGYPKPVHSTGALRPGEVLDVVADVSKAGRELGWRPRITLDEGLSETVAWMRSSMGAGR